MIDKLQHPQNKDFTFCRDCWECLSGTACGTIVALIYIPYSIITCPFGCLYGAVQPDTFHCNNKTIGDPARCGFENYKNLDCQHHGGEYPFYIGRSVGS